MNHRIRLFLLSILCSAGIVFAQSETYSAESVDLGLSVKWATCNLGAKLSHEVGDYYAWGETEPKETYAWETYLHCNGTDESLTKYCWNSSLGTVDDLRQLEAEDDAAAIKLGAGARIPTADEWQELIDNTYQEKTTVSGVAGWRFTSKKNGQSIFIPNGGYKSTSGYDDYYKDQVYCWASTNYKCSGSSAQYLWAAYNSATIGSITRCVGMNIRSVFDEVPKEPEEPTSVYYGALVLWNKDGSQMRIKLTEKPNVRFNAGTIEIKSDKANLNFDFKSVLKITYEEALPEAITPIEVDGGRLYDVVADGLTFYPSGKDLTVRIYSLNGSVVKAFVVKQNHPVTVPFNVIGSGIFVLSVNEQTSKIELK